MRWRYADRDCLARVETLQRGDRIYLPGAGPAARGNGGRVVSHLELYPADDTAPRGLPARVVVVYFTGARARAVKGEERDRSEPGELVTAGLRWLEMGERVRCRRAERVAAA